MALPRTRAAKERLPPAPSTRLIAPPVRHTGLTELASAIAQVGVLLSSMRERVGLLEAVVENFPGGLSLFDKDSRMVICNRRQREMLEYPDALFRSGFPSLEELFRFNALRGEYGPGNVEEHVARRIALVRERKAHVYERTRPNGTVVEVRGMPVEGGGFVTTYFDVTEQRRNQALIAHMAHHDGLTDLPNRLLFADRLHTAIALAKRTGLVAVHCLDLDGFKSVNDTLGHKAGDELLVRVAHRLTETVRENDTVARLGGDEFAIVQTGISSASDAAILARRVLNEFEKPIAVGGAQRTVGVSIGVALAPVHGVSVDDVLSKADTALYKSKRGGKNRFSLFNM